MNNKITVEYYKVDPDTGNFKRKNIKSIEPSFLEKGQIEDIKNKMGVPNIDIDIPKKKKITSFLKIN